MGLELLKKNGASKRGDRITWDGLPKTSLAQSRFCKVEKTVGGTNGTVRPPKAAK